MSYIKYLFEIIKLYFSSENEMYTFLLYVFQ